jgi:hypothetical protein
MSSTSPIWAALHHRILKMGAGQRVERAEGLVEQQDLRLHGERPGNADTLLHAAGNFCRPFVPGVRHLNEVEIGHDPVMPLGFGLGRSEHLGDGDVYILVDRQPGKQAVVLEHHGALRSRRIDLPVFEQDGARRHRRETGDQVEKRGLAAAGMADDRNELTLVDGQVDVAQHVRACAAAVEMLGDMVELEIGLHDRLLQLVAAPRVMNFPTAETSLSRMKPVTPI